MAQIFVDLFPSFFGMFRSKNNEDVINYELRVVGFSLGMKASILPLQKYLLLFVTVIAPKYVWWAINAVF
ncbi:MAG: hypothetical protein KF829_02710 [Ferruginibacter sp.]|nr:hypothetical protein [Ferruginibacter sp.]